jgi:hypothetical protein
LLNATAPLVIGHRPDTDPDIAATSDRNLATLFHTLEGSPGGGTPLCEHIRAVINDIRIASSELKRNGQKAIVVIATDGESSDGEMASAMAPLKDLPVHVVIRMCTDDERIGTYWNNIDTQLELSMDILDDFAGEAAEVTNHNRWLVYGEQLHRLREWGIIIKEFDLLDESKLSSEQMRAVIAHM